MLHWWGYYYLLLKNNWGYRRNIFHCTNERRPIVHLYVYEVQKRTLESMIKRDVVKCDPFKFFKKPRVDWGSKGKVNKINFPNKALWNSCNQSCGWPNPMYISVRSRRAIVGNDASPSTIVCHPQR